MTAIHEEVVRALPTFADRLGEVNATYADIANAMPSRPPPYEVHEALLDLNNDGRLPGNPMFTNDAFNGRAPGAGQAFSTRLKQALFSSADRTNRVRGTYAEVASQVDATAGEVHQGLLQLNDDGCFNGRPFFTNDDFELRLPEE